MKKIVSVMFFLLFVGIQAQELWQKRSSDEFSSSELVERKNMPHEYALYDLDFDALKTRLQMVIQGVPQNLSLPYYGKMETFAIEEASIMESELQEDFPYIRSFVGVSIDNSKISARFSLGTDGLHVMIQSPTEPTVYLDPFTKDRQVYIAYSKRDLPSIDSVFRCEVSETSNEATPSEYESTPFNANDGILRTYRLAVVTTGEYSQFHWINQGVSPSASDADKKAAVLSAINTTMTRVNGIYERDLGVRMVLVNNNTDIIFLDAVTDNLSNNSAGALISESQTTCDNVIGNANYDVGHAFSTGAGGLARLRSVCNTGIKARGVTGLSSPIGDPYDVDYVAHEFGHQFGANHTQNNNCQRNFTTSVEPGSASTIMGYAGICAPNVQNNSDDYFHAISIEEMWDHVQSTSCSNNTSTGNSAPVITSIPDFVVPHSTALVLEGNATDVNSDPLTYTWEQMDPEFGINPPVDNFTQGPVFRSVQPTSSPNRYLPALSTILGGSLSSTWEVIPSVGRTMNFRLTVRDNHPGGGNTASEDVTITVSGTAGPFEITSQNTATTWDANTTQTITWDVANTNVTPVNTPNVDILFSTDGGNTYPITLATAVPNNGSTSITVPNIATTTGRVMVKGTDNIFFDINNASITIGNLGVNDTQAQKEGWEIYPVPAKDVLYISANPQGKGDTTVQIFDAKGSLVKTLEIDNLNDAPYSINLSGWSPGNYFMTLANDTQKLTKKFIVQ